jgi:predicted permease
MLEHFMTVGQQVFVLFLLMAVGFILGRFKLINDTVSKGFSNLIIYVISPCALIVAFQRPVEGDSLRGFLMATLAAVIMHVVYIIISQLLIRGKGREVSILRFSSVFSNCGFMGYPLQLALLGTIGMFYGSAYVVVFTFATWTYGIYMLTGDRSKLSWKPLLFNPGVISLALAMGLYLLRITLPELLLTPVSDFAALNAPLPMVVVGYQLSQSHPEAVLKSGKAWLAAALRLIVFPLLGLGLGLLLRLDKTVLVAVIISAAAPPAALLTIFSEKFDLDAHFAASVVSVHTVLSVLTMPLIVGLAQMLAL